MLKRITDRDFWSNLPTEDPTQCWEWQGAKNGDGYGYFFGKRAHRVAFELINGRPPIRLVLHTCDNRACCNPKHLMDGSHTTNMEHMTQSNNHDGKNRRGEKHPASKLSDANRREIRTSKQTGRFLAHKFNVSESTISMTKHGKRGQYA